MKRLIVITLALLLSCSLVSTAQATPKQQRQIVALQKQVAALRLTNSQLTTEHDNLGRENASLAATVTSLQSNLQDMTGERDSYRNQLAAIPTELSRAISIVRDQVAYTKLVSQRQGRTVDDGYLISTAAMNYVVGHVTAGEYGFRNEIASLPLPSPHLASIAESALQMQAGICGTAAMTFRSIVMALGLPVRSVQFYFADGINNHIADETFYGGGWHYFDPTWGLTFSSGTDALSVADARSGASFTRHIDQNLLWYLTAPSSLTDELPLLTDPATLVETGVAF